MATPRFHIELYESDGDCPVERWLTEELDTIAASAVGLAMNHIVQGLGPDVVATRFGKALGKGLFEFRLDDTVDELLRRLGLPKKSKLAKAKPTRMLLRVFFHVHGDKLILLLGGYDKGKADSKREQQAQIELARARLREWASRKRLATGRGGKHRS
jgi:putative component of toxin-antitoxin plasmid stabilization module